MTKVSKPLRVKEVIASLAPSGMEYATGAFSRSSSIRTNLSDVIRRIYSGDY